jgi:hypothetical protein
LSKGEGWAKKLLEAYTNDGQVMKDSVIDMGKDVQNELDNGTIK